MPRAILQTIEIDLPHGQGAEEIIEALAPFPARLMVQPWMFGRAPYHQDIAYAAGGKIGKIQMGKDATDEEIAAGAAKTKATSLRTVTSAAGAMRTPQTLSFVLRNDIGTAAGTRFCAVSTPAIPWPFRITGFTVSALVTTNEDDQWNLHATDGTYQGLLAEAPPDALIQPLIASNFFGHFIEDRTDYGPNMQQAAPLHQQSYATGTLGRTVFDARKCLTFVSKPAATAASFAHQAVVTVEESFLGAGATEEAALRLRASPLITTSATILAARPQAPTIEGAPPGGVTLLGATTITPAPTAAPAAAPTPAAPPKVTTTKPPAATKPPAIPTNATAKTADPTKAKTAAAPTKAKTGTTKGPIGVTEMPLPDLHDYGVLYGYFGPDAHFSWNGEDLTIPDAIAKANTLGYAPTVEYGVQMVDDAAYWEHMLGVIFGAPTYP